MESPKVAMFDFCGTLANFQTADPFVDFVRLHSRRFSSFWLKILHTIMRKLQIIKFLTFLYPYKSLNKRIYALQLRGLSFSELDKLAKSYYINIVRPNLIQRSVEELTRLQREGSRIVVVSGGYDLYIKYFAKEFGINPEDLICTSLKFSNEVCTGLLNGNDCMFSEKVRRLDKSLKEFQKYSVAYSDSKSDIPFLEWAEIGYVVVKTGQENWDIKKKYKRLEW